MGYALVIVFQAVAVLALIALQQLFPLGERSIIYILVVLLATYVFGIGPGILALILGWLSYTYFFISPFGSLWPLAVSPAGWVSQASYLIGTAAFGIAAALLRRSRLRAEALADRLDQELEERRRSEEELETNWRLFNDLLDNSATAIYVKDMEGRLLLANRALADLLGYDKEEMIGKTSYDFYPREIAEAHIENDRQVLESGEPYEAEEVVPEDGTVRMFISIKFPLRDGGGEHIRSGRHFKGYYRSQAGRGVSQRERGKIPRCGRGTP